MLQNTFTTFEDRALDIKDVCRVLSCGHAHVYRMIERENFPRPAKAGRKSVWLYSDVLAWLRKKSAEANPV
jgi:predicted DNA-binding transcriptional regulator AlpA